MGAAGSCFAYTQAMTSLEFAYALQLHGYVLERNGKDRITLIRTGDHRRVSVPANQVLYPRTLQLLLLAAEVDEAAFERASSGMPGNRLPIGYSRERPRDAA